ncbi:MAG: hypothetical protein Ta2D_01830 [Rickettsiales bacterium]|nr:MAG: hypothetical protein Ta2D_01830 [Rickettsiales bacterium]
MLENDAIKIIDYKDMLKRSISTFSKAKKYYKSVLDDFKESGEIDFFANELKFINEVQGKENFKKITGYDYIDFYFDKNNIKTEENILKLVQLEIMRTGKQEVAKRTNLTIPTINKIFKSRNMTYKTFFNLTNALQIEIRAML